MSSSLDSFNPNAAIMVASIDFGTTYSGYSYSFKDKPNDIIKNQNWGEELSTSSYKTPTSVLIDGSKQFVSFGYKAEHEYSQCCAAGKGDDYHLFRHFKMLLYKNKVGSKLFYKILYNEFQPSF